MSRCLEESLASLERDKALKGVLGKRVVERYVGVKRGERRCCGKWRRSRGGSGLLKGISIIY